MQRNEYAVIRHVARSAEARRSNLYRTEERPSLSSFIPNALPSVIRFAAKIRRDSARLLIPLQLCWERNGRSHCEERGSATRQSLCKKARSVFCRDCFVAHYVRFSQ
ncbi:MAG: hypothetical protein LBL66_09895 [Clostridiales bacterium]|nr:hypothetical protein [Clostridiales bacterium]